MMTAAGSRASRPLFLARFKTRRLAAGGRRWPAQAGAGRGGQVSSASSASAAS